MTNQRLVISLPLSWEQVAPNTFEVDLVSTMEPLVGRGLEEMARAYKLDDAEIERLVERFENSVHREGIARQLLLSRRG